MFSILVIFKTGLRTKITCKLVVYTRNGKQRMKEIRRVVFLLKRSLKANVLAFHTRGNISLNFTKDFTFMAGRLTCFDGRACAVEFSTGAVQSAVFIHTTNGVGKFCLSVINYRRL